MIIVQGACMVDPADRASLIQRCSEEMLAARQDPGCLEYVLIADPFDPSRVLLSARWESMDDLDAHDAKVGAGDEAATSASAWSLCKSQELTVYDDSARRPADWDQLQR